MHCNECICIKTHVARVQEHGSVHRVFWCACNRLDSFRDDLLDHANSIRGGVEFYSSARCPAIRFVMFIHMNEHDVSPNFECYCSVALVNAQ